MTIRPNNFGFNHFKRRPTAALYRYVSTPPCLACYGSTIGAYGEQCRTCKGAGFLTYKGGQVAGLATRKR